MLDIKFIRENKEKVLKGARDKRFNVDLDKILELDEQRRKVLTKVESLRSLKNTISKEVPALKGEEKNLKIGEMKNVSEEEKKLSSDLKLIEEEFEGLMLKVPSVAAEDVPIGKDESENVEAYKVGEIRQFNFPVKDHVTLGKICDIIDIERGVKLSGQRNYFLKNEGALIHLAVMQFALHKIVGKGFQPFVVPLMVNREAMVGTGYFPGGEEQAYHIEKDGKYLIGTSEVPLAAYHFDEILAESELPKLYAGYSQCFRREAGTYGKDTHGLYRIHQFDKVEQVVICANDLDESVKMHKFLLKNAEELLQDLKLPYRVVDVCTGDLGMGQVKKYDIETWMPSRNSYGETHSCSMFFEFQSRRSKIRYKDKSGKIQFAHTLNNTLVASPRILIPILENYQNEDGSITVPDCLKNYMAGISIINPRKKLS